MLSMHQFDYRNHCHSSCCKVIGSSRERLASFQLFCVFAGLEKGRLNASFHLWHDHACLACNILSWTSAHQSEQVCLAWQATVRITHVAVMFQNGILLCPDVTSQHLALHCLAYCDTQLWYSIACHIHLFSMVLCCAVSWNPTNHLVLLGMNPGLIKWAVPALTWMLQSTHKQLNTGTRLFLAFQHHYFLSPWTKLSMGAEGHATML